MSCPSASTRAPSRSFSAPSRAVKAAGPAPAITRSRLGTRIDSVAGASIALAHRTRDERDRLIRDGVRPHLLGDHGQHEQGGRVAHRVRLGGLGRARLDRMGERCPALRDRDDVDAGGRRERPGGERVGRLAGVGDHDDRVVRSNDGRPDDEGHRRHGDGGPAGVLEHGGSEDRRRDGSSPSRPARCGGIVAGPRQRRGPVRGWSRRQEMEQLVRLGSDLLLEVRARLRGHDSTPSRPDVGEGA